MSETGFRNRVLALASAAEAGTGLALMIAPGLVGRLLLGADLGLAGEAAGRCFGVALVALAVACWPRRAGGQPRARRGMLIYNALIALYLAGLGAVGHMAGPLLWPAVVLHAGVALALGWPARRSPSTE